MPKKRRYYKGKKVSKGELKIAQSLEQRQVLFEMEKTFKDCRGRNERRPLRFDFYLPGYNILIEYDGEHHYDPVNKGYRARYVHERTKINDQIKNSYIEKKGIGLLRIPHWEYDQIDEILNGVLK